jgi:PPOX class probable F420-dependent enzyme
MKYQKIEIDSHIGKRLSKETVVWLTTVSSDGTPQPNPVWFYWTGKRFIIYSSPSSAKVKNIHRNPKVSLNLEGAETLGGDVVVFKGEAQLKESSMVINPGYLRKYSAAAAKWGRTPEDIIAEFSVEIQIVPTKVRTY